MRLIALHGFLGTSYDWTDLFRGHFLQDCLHPRDLFSGNIEKMDDWAKAFNQERPHSSHDTFLLGYSLGGRLALHALLNAPDHWPAAVLVSTHLGLSCSKEKELRRKSDEEWALRFMQDPWDPLMQAWNSQGVFQGDSFSFKRKECDYSRLKLAAVLKEWSLSRQEDLKSQVSNLNIPILWIAGELDGSYAKVAKEVQLKHPLSEIWIVPKSGHRVPWQMPQQFLLKITHFLNRVRKQL